MYVSIIIVHVGFTREVIYNHHLLLFSADWLKIVLNGIQISDIFSGQGAVLGRYMYNVLKGQGSIRIFFVTLNILKFLKI